MKKSFSWLQKEEVNEIAKQLKVKPEEVIEMEKRMTGKDVHFDPLVPDDESGHYAPSMYLPADQDSPEEEAEKSEWSDRCHRLLYKGLAELDQRSREIIEARWLNDQDKKPTLHALAKRYKISAERVRQIENQAIKQLKKSVTV